MRTMLVVAVALVVSAGSFGAAPQVISVKRTEISSDAARKLVEACVAYAERNKVLVGAAVVGIDGVLIDFHLMQGATATNSETAILKAKTAEKQEPFAAVLSCADSRVPVELVFDQSIGHLFVVRVAGNVATPEITASLEYGIAVLGTKVLMVLGHGNCGAVKATIEGKAVPGQISALYAPIRPAVDAAGPDLGAAIDANAKIQASLLSKASPIIAGAIKEKKLKVVPARYDLASGRVSLLA